MSKTFRSWDVDQGWLLPPSVHEFVPAGHLAHFVRDTVREGLDLTAILGAYAVDRGQPPYHPGMMTALLLYGYSRGVYSSRRLAQACEERVDFMAVTGLNKPDFHTISEFRRRHLAALSELFVQVLKLCQAAGLVKLGHVAVDGTKLAANASRHKAMSYGRMKTTEPKLAAEVEAWLKAAEAADRAEDAEHGAGLRGDETPAWMADKRERLARIRAAKAELEAEAAGDPADLDPEGPGPSTGMQAKGKPKRAEDGGPPDKAQRNFTDPDCRILPTKDGFIAGYNAQIAVDHAHQIIVAQRLATNPADYAALLPLVDQARANLARKLREVSGDSGFATEANIAAMAARKIRAYLPPGRRKHADAHVGGERHLVNCPRMTAMARKLKRAGYRSRYRLRKHTVEPVFGQIKQARGFRQHLLRGLDKARGEWALICTAHNLLKLAGARA
ncbi:IS1182 family transposase [Phenylobacterium sp.]|uniref:IS1182 family transposase n=1 Tax=Phenylobacterium sp. TaxID=1871053 RepID=UPI00286ABE5E|nr:IS1182 family transposase [Phenylobacterium sp.]